MKAEDQKIAAFGSSCRELRDLMQERNVNARLIRRSKYKKGGFGRPFLWPLPLHYSTHARQDLSENRSREATKIVQE
ncbi:Uncharacterised protein [Pseudomonas fluorescens]|uniref:Uncharacterized protein n=1 Tax=Pseudomonas fluorescens TaxID=294 RepID=A0A3S4QZ38_PSEFL|nr:hypothetical protein [Pseudomonas fluorescens]VEF06364.1 Uncharacterised protein [Pseudomonas fluorescens]